MFKLIITFFLTLLKIFVYSKAEYYKPLDKCEDCLPSPLFMQNNGIYGYPCLPQGYQTQNRLLKHLTPMRRIDSATGCINCITPQKFSALIAGRPQKQDIEIDVKKEMKTLPIPATDKIGISDLEAAKSDALKKTIENQFPDPFFIPVLQKNPQINTKTKQLFISNSENDFYNKTVSRNDREYPILPPNCFCLPETQPMITIPTPLPLFSLPATPLSPPLPPPLSLPTFPIPTQPTPMYMVPQPQLPIPRLQTPLPSAITPETLTPPINNCCTLCNSRCRPILKANKMLVSKTAHFKNPLNKFYQMSNKTIESNESTNNECTSKELKSIIEKNSNLKMAKAKELIQHNAEKRLKKEMIHVVCSSTSLEYITRSSIFCIGAVADGTCYIFQTSE